MQRKIPFYPVFKMLSMVFKNGGLGFRGSFIFGFFLLRYIVFEPFRLLELLFFENRIQKHELSEDPIFVVGHWRSGTSHLQNLLRKDSHHTTTTIFTSLFADIYILTEIWLKRPLNALLKLFRVPYSLQRLPFDFDLPAELDVGMCSICSLYAYTWGHLFPKRFEALTPPLLKIENKTIAKNWIEDYNYLIKKLSFYHNNKRLVIKSPGDTARIWWLFQKYPNAKFVYLYRNPIHTFHSNRYLWKVIQNENSFQKIDKTQIDHHIINTYKLVINQYLEDQSKIPRHQIIEVNFKDLQEQPLETLQKIYTHLDLGTLEAEAISPFIKRNKSYKPNRYITSKELENRLRGEWKFAFDEMKNTNQQA
jgi:hypothetical protein